MWSVIILGLIKMLLKTVSFDHLAVYLISEEHNLGKKPHHKYNGCVRTGTGNLDPLDVAQGGTGTLSQQQVGSQSCRSVLQQTAGIAAMKCP